MIKLGDLSVISQETPPPKLLAAVTAIGERLHPILTEQGFRTKDSCVLCSLTVRDFLQAIGFDEAVVAPVVLIVRELKDGVQGHSVGVGLAPRGGRKVAAFRWAGHMVVTLPRIGWLIDPTVYQAQRPQWPELPGMAVVKLGDMGGIQYEGMPAIGGFAYHAEDRMFDAGWFDNPGNRHWRKGPDAEPWRRAVAVSALTAAMKA